MVKKEVKVNNRTHEAFNQLREELIKIKEEIRVDIVGPVVASFGFIIALVWRDAIKGALDVYLERAGLTNQAYLYNFVSAMIVTIFVILLMLFILRLSKKRKEENIKKAVEKVSE